MESLEFGYQCTTAYGDFNTNDFIIGVACDASTNLYSNTEAISVTEKIVTAGDPLAFHEFLKTHFVSVGPNTCPATYGFDASPYGTNPGNLILTEPTAGTFRVTP
jgi:hypothetical protein